MEKSLRSLVSIFVTAIEIQSVYRVVNVLLDTLLLFHKDELRLDKAFTEKNREGKNAGKSSPIAFSFLLRRGHQFFSLSYYKKDGL